MKLEETLNGGYPGLYEEVVTDDIYKIRDVDDIVSINDPNYVHVKGHKGIKFKPDIILDLGANIGIFSRYAQELFPKANLIAVEPDEKNFNILKDHTKGALINKAIGSGSIYHYPNAKNGAMEVYVSKSMAFDLPYLKKETSPAQVESLMITDLKKYIKKGDKVLCKIDIEGNETVIFDDPDSVAMLKTFDYIAIELHYYASTEAKSKKIRDLSDKLFTEFKKTHKTLDENIHFYATKKK